MHAKKVSHKIIDNACSWMHAARRNVLAEAVLAAVAERRLTVTSLGRALDSTAKEKNCIKRMDRLIGNEHLFRAATIGTDLFINSRTRQKLRFK